MKTAELPVSSGTPSSGKALAPGRKTAPRVWLLLGLSALSVALWLRWDWLAAIGLAPVIAAVLPCAVMCALGVCMRCGTAGAKAASRRPPAP